MRDVNADHAASHLGKAEGIVTLLRSMAYYRSKRHVLIPLDLLMRVRGFINSSNAIQLNIYVYFGYKVNGVASFQWRTWTSE